jgi:serine phosphatase RsbU (regulator of sigma subunit)
MNKLFSFHFSKCHTIRLFVILNLYLLNSCFLQAQDLKELGSPLIQNFSAEDYGGSPGNWAAIQDWRGVLYFANPSGILEFDGKNWRLITTQSKSEIYSFAIDQYGTIFVGGIDELGWLGIDEKGNRLFVSLTGQVPEENKKFGVVRWIVASTAGIYFITSTMIFYYNWNTLHCIPFSKPLRGFNIYDQVFFHDSHQGIHWMDGITPRPLPLTSGFSYDKSSRLFIMPYPQGKMLVLCSKMGFFLYDPKKLIEQIIEFDFYGIASNSRGIQTSFPTEIDPFIKIASLYKAEAIKNNCFAISRLFFGIFIIDSQGKFVQYINKNRGLAGNIVWNLFQDKDQNLWAVLSKGISCIKALAPMTLFPIEEGAFAITRHNGVLYSGSSDGLFYLPEYKADGNKINDRNDFVHHSEVRPECYNFIQINGQLYGAMWNGVCQIGRKQHKKIHSSDKGAVLYLAWSEKFPNIMFLAQSSGFSALKIDFSADLSLDIPPKTMSIQKEETPTLNSEKFNNIKDGISKICVDDQGNLWLTTRNEGILYIQFFGPTISDCRVFRFTTLHGLPHNEDNFVNLINKRLIIATRQGIYEAVRGKDFMRDPMSLHIQPELTFGRMFYEQKLSVGQMAIDEAENIWVKSQLGFGCLKKTKSNDYEWNAIPFKEMQYAKLYQFMVEPQGIIWVTTDRGIYRYDSKIAKNYQSTYNTLLRSVRLKEAGTIFNGCYFNAAEKKGEYYFQTASKQPEILITQFPYRHNAVVFEYSAPFYESINKNLFSYQLHGFDQQWSDWTGETIKEYSNLPEGTYCFKVKAKNIFEHLGQETSFSFTILPPWQRMWWAYILYGLFLVCLFFMGIRLNSKRLVAAKARLEKAVKERTVEVVRQKDEIAKQKEEIETYVSDLYSSNQKLADTNVQLVETKNALWGEMELAKKIQTVLLPENPHIPGYEISAYMNPADEVGGDYYDVIEVKREWIVSSEQWLVEPEKAWKKDEDLCSGDACLHPDSERDEEEDGQSCRGGSCARPQAFGQPHGAGLQYPNMGNHQGLPLQGLPPNPESGQPQGFAPTVPSNLYPSHWLAIGDVSGHGVPAGLVMMMVQTSIRSVIRESPHSTPDKILASVNQTIYENIKKLGEDKYMTITLISVQENGMIYYAGLHQDIMIFRAAKNKIDLLETKGMWIGMMDDIANTLQVDQFHLQPNDVMLLYTDGITEALDKEGQMFSEDKLVGLFHKLGNLSPEEIKAGILQSLQGYQCSDDITLMILKRI